MDFTELLDSSLTCELEILNKLHQNSNWITLVELETSTGYNKKTIMKYLKILAEKKDIIAAKVIHIKKGTGVKLALSDYQYKVLKISIINECIPFTIIKMITETGSVSLSRLMQETFLSESSINRHITKLKKHLQMYNLNLVTNNGSYYFSGNEHTLRYYLYAAFWEVYHGITWPFNDQLFDKISSDIGKLSKYLTYQMSASMYNQATLVLAINFLRYQNGHPIQIEKDWVELIDINKTSFKYFNNLAKMLIKFYCLPIQETHFFVLYLLTNTFLFQDPIGEIIMKKHHSLETEISSITNLVLSKFRFIEASCIDKSDKDLVERNLFAIHYHALLFPNFNNDISNYDIITDVKKRYPRLCEKGSQILDETRSIYGNPLLDASEFLIAQYSIICAFLTSESIFEKPYYVGLETDFPFLVNEITKKNIKKFFSSSYNIEFVDSSYEDLDLLLTVPLKLEKNDKSNRRASVPKIFISPIIKPSELKEMYLKIVELHEFRKFE